MTATDWKHERERIEQAKRHRFERLWVRRKELKEELAVIETEIDQPHLKPENAKESNG